MYSIQPKFLFKRKDKMKTFTDENREGLLLRIPHEETLKSYALGRRKKNNGAKSKVQERIMSKENQMLLFKSK